MALAPDRCGLRSSPELVIRVMSDFQLNLLLTSAAANRVLTIHRPVSPPGVFFYIFAFGCSCAFKVRISGRPSTLEPPRFPRPGF